MFQWRCTLNFTKCNREIKKNCFTGSYVNGFPKGNFDKFTAGSVHVTCRWFLLRVPANLKSVLLRTQTETFWRRMQDRETETLSPTLLLSSVTFFTQIQLKRACPFKNISVIPGLMLLLAQLLCIFSFQLFCFLMHNMLIFLDINFPVSDLFMSISLAVIYLRTTNKRIYFGPRFRFCSCFTGLCLVAVQKLFVFLHA